MPQGYKTFFMFNSTVPEMYHPHKCLNAKENVVILTLFSRINDKLLLFKLKSTSILGISV